MSVSSSLTLLCKEIFSKFSFRSLRSILTLFTLFFGSFISVLFLHTYALQGLRYAYMVSMVPPNSLLPLGFTDLYCKFGIRVTQNLNDDEVGKCSIIQLRCISVQCGESPYGR